MARTRMRLGEVRPALDGWLEWLAEQPDGSRSFGELRELDGLVERLPHDEGRAWLDEHWPEVCRVLTYVSRREQGTHDASTP